MSIYESIYHDVLNKIANEIYRDGTLLPSEKEFMRLYDCSLAPVRQAMFKLESLGLVERKRGKGTFIKSTNPKDYLQGGNGFTRILHEERENVSYITIDVSKMKASDVVAEKLGVAQGEDVVRVKRIGKYRDTVIQYSQHYIPNVDKLDIIKKEGNIFNWYFFMAGKLGINIIKSIDEVFVTCPDEETQKYFLSNRPLLPPLVSIDRISFDRTKTPQEYSIYTQSMSQIGSMKIKFTYEINW